MAGNDRSTLEFTEADGRQLAVDMLRKLREWTERVNERECDKVSDDEDEPDMREAILGEEPEIFRRYLATMQSKNSAALERGFLCVLSHFMAESIEDSEIESYDGYIVPRPGLRI